jgi:hypothetical protein
MRRASIGHRAPLLSAVAAALIGVVSCADPPHAPAQGAAALQWAVSTSGTKNPLCVPGPHWSNAPVAAGDQPLVSATEVMGGMVVDGQNGAFVTCRVSPHGEQFVVSGEIHSTSSDGQLLTELAVSFSIAPHQPDAQGTLYITDQVSRDFAFSSDTTIIPPKPGCIFSVQSSSNQLGVGPGRVWAEVKCPHISDWRNRDKQECEIADGFLVLENCLQD